MKIKDNYENYFFDFFGTIMFRDCSADDIKRIWAKQFSAYFNYKISDLDLYKTRISSEQKIASATPNQEFEYSQLTEEIYDRVAITYNIDITYEDFSVASKKIEIQIEKAHQKINRKLINEIVRLKNLGKKAYILSDFYFGASSLEEFLDDKKVDIKFDEIFVSCEWGANKSTGKIYQMLIERYALNSSNAVMVGDNLRSDIINAARNGFDTYKISSPKDSKLSVNSKKELSKTLLNGKRSGISYSNYGVTLFLFTKKLYENVIKNGVNTVFFFAREGEFLKKLFDIYCVCLHKKYNLPIINSKYLYVSRQATYGATLKNLPEETFEKLFESYSDMSISVFLSNLGFSGEQIKTVESFSPVSLNENIKNIKDSDEFSALKNSKDFKELYSKVIREKKELLNGYLAQEGFFDGDKAIVVDVGWKGSIQDNISLAIGSRVDIEGYYYGLLNTSAIAKSNNKCGLIFSEYPYQSRNCKIWSFDCNFFERLLSASHPSTKGYEVRDKEIAPIFNEFGSEQKNYDLILPIQNNIVAIFKKISEKYFELPIFSDDIEKFAAATYVDTTCKISSSNMKLQTELLYGQKENFGYQKNTSSVIRSRATLGYLLSGNLYAIKKLKSPIFLSRILNTRHMYFLSALIYKTQVKKLKNDIH